MKNENINIDKSLREKLESFSVQPPPHVWDNVKGQMFAQKKQNRMVYLRWISAAAVVVFAFIAGWYFNNRSPIETPTFVQEQIVQPELQHEEKNGAEEIILNAESIKNQGNDINTEEKEIIEENINTTQINLLAASMQTINAADSYSNSERIKMDRMNRKNVVFNKLDIPARLSKKSALKTDFNFSDSENLRIATNVTKLELLDKKETGWKMGMHVSPGYSSHVASHSDNYTQNMNYKGESGNGNMGGGFSIQYKTSKKLRIESGVYYAQSGQKSNSSPQFFSRNNEYFDAGVSGDNLQSNAPAFGFSNNVNVSNGNLLMNSAAGVIEMSGAPKGAQINTAPELLNNKYASTLITDGQFSQVFDFIEIPLYLRYNLLDAKFGIELMGGINAGVVVGNNAYVDNSYGLQNIGRTQDISTMNLAGTVGIGANYNLGKHISLAVEPRLNYYFNSINTNSEVVYRPYRIGIFTGLYYEF